MWNRKLLYRSTCIYIPNINTNKKGKEGLVDQSRAYKYKVNIFLGPNGKRKRVHIIPKESDTFKTEK
jgi:hypothetical protein